jgi:7-keto-8-aminopelargonate synthetase-like enzyme
LFFRDEAVGLAVQKGMQISRSALHYFKHNDMLDLERVLLEIEKGEYKKRRLTRKFIITEGLYQNLGDVCPLPRLVDFLFF